MIQNLSDVRKEELISSLTEELVVLRAKAGWSQEELAEFIGLSRQSYSSIESGKRQMTWRTYLALLFLLERNPRTHDMLHKLRVFPEDLVNRQTPESVET